MKNIHQSFPKPGGLLPMSCFVQATAPKPKDMQFKKIENRVKQQIEEAAIREC